MACLTIVPACFGDGDRDPGPSPIVSLSTDPLVPDTDPPTGTPPPPPAGPPCEAGALPAPPGLAMPLLANGVRLNEDPYESPQEMAYPPGDDSYWYVALHAGRIVRFLDDPATTTFEEVLDVSDRVMSDHEQLGMMSLTFHPDFASNGQLFVYYNRSPDVQEVGLYSRVSRFTSTDGGRTFDPGSEEILLDLYRVQDLHNGGHLEFGADGFLYVALGDGGGSLDPYDHGQDPRVLWGKLLRLDVDAAFPYAIPVDNPFADGVLAAPEIFALGLRNPWQWTIDPLTSEIWAADVGSHEWEEVNYIVAGGNYGWSVAEGPDCLDPGCDMTGLTPPAYTYPNEGPAAVIGGRVYRGALLPALEGYYLFADYFGQWLKGIRFDPISGGFDLLDVSPGLGMRPASFAVDLDGEVWFVHRDKGMFYTLAPIPEDGPDVTLPTQLLSQTGCTDPSVAPSAPSSTLRPYDVNVELWSDGASKARFLNLPEGTTIDVDPLTGDFDLPNGTVLMKHFELDGELVETRLLMRHTDGTWAGYSYEWSADQTDATLLEDSVTRTLANGLEWTYPSRSDCLVCHTNQAGVTLGLEVLQLTEVLDAWEQDGLFSAPLPGEFDDEEWVLPDIVDPTAPVSRRARGYLHANCSNCHRPGSQDPDFRYEVPARDFCDVAVAEPVLGANVLLSPGDPEGSALYQHMATTDVELRMPPLATVIPDPIGVAVVEEWIQEFDACDP